ncbi:MAG: prenyltransferase [Saccharospirillaceae bacterium]|nr:prenyltransferase [Saccharospirillaceae bacterium]MCD8532522.1 prenyltransferase [Saccharospirillaceae bacterium]
MFSTLRAVMQSTRGPFLILTPVCVWLAAAVVLQQGGNLAWPSLLLILGGALSAHISVNAINEYLDFRSGLDLNTERTPFSGGSGALPAQPHAAGAVLMSGILTLLITTLIGLWFLSQGIWQLLPLGLAGLILIITYTRQINRRPWLCLIAPGAGFGLAMVAGSAFALEARSTTTLWLAALVPFFLVNNLLLLNQYPDIAADRAVGRNHFPIAYGVERSTQAYALMMAATALTIIIGVVGDWFPLWSLLALVPVVLSAKALQGARTLAADIGTQPQFMAANVLATLLTPAILGLTLLFG